MVVSKLQPLRVHHQLPTYSLTSLSNLSLVVTLPNLYWYGSSYDVESLPLYDVPPCPTDQAVVRELVL